MLALGSFVVFGLPDGIIGTAWPSMRVGLAVLGPALITLALLVVAAELILTRLAPVTRLARPVAQTRYRVGSVGSAKPSAVM